ncbi:MAG TPA: hypothetical protein VHA76_04140, partial [Solirubrobacterales bacterium]|nr:hypothetical protein [Solirubrobacterales bacterium]
MPFSKSKHGRGPLQRLSDQRRSLALGGLAIGAVFSAVVLRRRRRGGEAEFERPVPPSVQPDFGPPADVDVPPPASEPEANEPLPEAVDTMAAVNGADPTEAAGETPINAGTADTLAETKDAPAETKDAPAETGDALAVDSSPPAEAPTPAAGPPAPASASAEPATGELSAEEASILSVLAQDGRADEDRTAIAVATSLERETADVA